MFSKIKAKRMHKKGVILAEKRDYFQALWYLEKAVELDDENGTIRYDLGLTYANNSDYHKALEEFKLSLRFQPYHSETYFAIATSLFPLGPDWKTAIFYLAYLDFHIYGEKANRAKERLTQLGEKARSFDAQTWLDEVIIHYNNFIKSTADTMEINMKSSAKDRDVALTEDGIIATRKWISETTDFLSSKWSIPHVDAGFKLSKKGKLRAAIAQYITGIELFPTNKGVIQLLVSSYLQAGDFAQARDIFTTIRLSEFQEMQIQELIDNYYYLQSIFTAK